MHLISSPPLIEYVGKLNLRRLWKRWHLILQLFSGDKNSGEFFPVFSLTLTGQHIDFCYCSESVYRRQLLPRLLPMKFFFIVIWLKLCDIFYKIIVRKMRIVDSERLHRIQISVLTSSTEIKVNVSYQIFRVKRLNFIGSETELVYSLGEALICYILISWSNSGLYRW